MTYMGSVDIMRQLGANTSDYDAVWPASSIWISMGDKNFRVKHTESISLSPVVFSIKKTLAESMGFVGKQVSINDIMEKISSGELKFCMTSATQSNSGASAYLGFLSGLSGNPEVLTMKDLENPELHEKITGLLQGVDRTSGSSEWLKTLFLQGDYDAMVNYESLIIGTAMENISLELLQKHSPEIKQEEPYDLNQEITAEDRLKVDEIKASLDLTESGQAVMFGVGAQRKLSEFSDIILAQMNKSDTAEAGQLLSDLLAAVENTEIEELGKAKGFLSIFPFFSRSLQDLTKLKQRYEKTEIQVDRIEGQLEQARMQILKDISLFDELYSRNLKYFRELQIYIKAGEEVIDEIRKKPFRGCIRKRRLREIPCQLNWWRILKIRSIVLRKRFMI